MATLTISLKKITAEVKFAERKSALLQNNNVKQILPFVQSYKVTPPLHHPKNNNFISKRHLIHPLQREIYKKARLSPRFSSAAKIFGHLAHSIELVRMCLACQHLDLNSAAGISDNLHFDLEVIFANNGEGIYLSVQQTFVPKNVCVGGYW